MNDQRLGAVLRAVRRRQRLRQQDVATRSGVSRTLVSRIERGHVDTLTVATLRRVAAALDVRIDVRAFSRSGDLDRLIAAGHSALHEAVARTFAKLPDWRTAPEVSFSIWGERGVVDLMAWNAKRRILLVIELKTAIVDVNELVGTFDRKLRLAIAIAQAHGWPIPDDATVAGWVVVEDSRTNRRRLDEHAAMLRAAFPRDGRTMRGWLARPRGGIRCLSFWHGTGN